MSFKNERFLVEAVEQCQLHKIITFIRHGHNIHIQNNHGQNLLIHLLKQQNFQDQLFEKKRLQMFQFLITHCKLDINTFDYHGKNVFNWATNLNCTQEALYLLRSYPGDIDILTRDQSGLCSLHYAIEHGNEILIHSIVDYLLQYRIRFDIHDNHNNTPHELAKKLGYNHISDYLYETSRSTIFMSREFPSFQQRPITNRSKIIITAKSNRTAVSSSSSSSSSSASSVSDSPDIHNLIESKIQRAKNLNDWKTVAVLRTYQTNPNGKKLHQLPPPTLQINKRTQSPISSKLPPINNKSSPSSSSGSISEQMLRLIEPQLCSSYRQPFIPYYQRPNIPTVGVIPASQRKVSVVPARRMSTVMGLRKSESNAGHLGVLTTQDAHSRLSLPPVYKQHRQSTVPGRLSDSDALPKLRAKNLITVQN